MGPTQTTISSWAVNFSAAGSPVTRLPLRYTRTCSLLAAVTGPTWLVVNG